MISTEEIDERACRMGDEREAYITARGWGVPSVRLGASGRGRGPDDGRSDRFSPSGVYSLSAAVREQLAREDPDARPNALGRYYDGDEPAGRLGTRW